MERNIGKQSITDCLKIVLYGPESTGKTTLTKTLANFYETVFVPEFARTFLQKKWEASQEVCSLDDLLTIVDEQIKLENQQVQKANNILFCDTNIVVIQVWSETHFDGYCHPEISKKTQEFHYDYYFLTDIDIPWEKDDLRDRPNNRKEMFDAFQEKLEQYGYPYTVLSGNEETRFLKAKAVITALLEKQIKT